MTIAVDTNVFQALWEGTPALSAAAQTALEQASRQGAIIISPAVYAELLAGSHRDTAIVEEFFRAAEIRIDWNLNRAVWQTTALAFRDYADRRRTQGRGPGPRRILADFLIGAHAVHYATALLTFDQDIYRAAFPTLTVLVPPTI